MGTKVQQITEINGVVLTEMASSTLQQYQTDDNRALRMDIDELSETVIFMEKLFFLNAEPTEEMINEGREHLQCIIEVREHLKALKKP